MLPCIARILFGARRASLQHEKELLPTRVEGTAMDATTRLLASYAAEISYDALTPSAIHECKRRIIDTLACATAAFDAEPVAIARHMARSRSCTQPSRILGDGTRTTPEQA